MPFKPKVFLASQPLSCKGHMKDNCPYRCELLESTQNGEPIYVYECRLREWEERNTRSSDFAGRFSSKEREETKNPKVHRDEHLLKTEQLISEYKEIKRIDKIREYKRRKAARLIENRLKRQRKYSEIQKSEKQKNISFFFLFSLFCSSIILGYLHLISFLVSSHGLHLNFLFVYAFLFFSFFSYSHCFLSPISNYFIIPLENRHRHIGNSKRKILRNLKRPNTVSRTKGKIIRGIKKIRQTKQKNQKKSPIFKETTSLESTTLPSMPLNSYILSCEQSAQIDIEVEEEKKQSRIQAIKNLRDKQRRQNLERQNKRSEKLRADGTIKVLREMRGCFRNPNKKYTTDDEFFLEHNRALHPYLKNQGKCFYKAIFSPTLRYYIRVNKSNKEDKRNHIDTVKFEKSVEIDFITLCKMLKEGYLFFSTQRNRKPRESATYPKSFISVPPKTRLITADYEIKNYGMAIESKTYGDFAVINGYLPRKDQITEHEIKDAFPDYNGYITYDMVKQLLSKRPESEVLIGYVNDGKLTLENIYEYDHLMWGVIIWQGLDAVPIVCELNEKGSHSLTKLSILKDSEYTRRESQSPESSTRKSVTFSDKLEESTHQHLPLSQNELANWFKNRTIMQTKGGGKCGAHALHGALTDIGFDITFDDICAALTAIDRDEDNKDKIITSWWSIESIWDYCEQLGVGVRLMRIQPNSISYWETRYNCESYIGLTADGTHYQWTKAKTYSFNEPEHLQIKSDESISEKRYGRKNTPSESSQTTSKTAKLFKNLKNIDNISDILEIEKLENINVIKGTVSNKFLKEQPRININHFSVDTNNIIERSQLRTELLQSPHFTLFPRDLQQYIIESSYEDVSVDYSHPKIENKLGPVVKVIYRPVPRVEPHIPSRLDNPLIPLPKEILTYVQTGELSCLTEIHDHHKYSVQLFRDVLNKLLSEYNFNVNMLTTDINVLKNLSRQTYGYRNRIISKMCTEMAIKGLNKDMSIVTMENTNLIKDFTEPEELPSILNVMQRIRIGVTLKLQSTMKENEEFKFVLNNNGTYTISGDNEGEKFLLLNVGNWFILYHSGVNQIYFGSAVYMDYIIAYAECRHNLMLIRCAREYDWARQIIDYLLEHSESFLPHNDAVTFMKNYESLCLFFSDIQDSPFVNWSPILETISDMLKIANKYSPEPVSLSFLLCDLFNIGQHFDVDNILIHLINVMKPMTGSQLQEISSLHKFLYFAECDEDAGMTKFLKRVHTKRTVNKEAVKTMVNFAKRQFCLNYYKKHNIAPNFKEENAKTMTIKEALKNKNSAYLLSLPLQWWSDVIPWNCLDNTTTNDPLEVAKDKGAILPKIKFGPGDSQRELQQVISRQEYDFKQLPLEDFSSVKEQKVYEMRQLWREEEHNNAVRLCPKEKEQKVEARLFGIANIDNKHGLSILMNKAKKALSYFDTEVMTKQDKERKMKLHDMGQQTLDKQVYSILLDIEGHNQSMQYDNCAELYEFVGGLYGESNWCNLANYFSNLTVYFYKEYIDKTTVSEGQLGGIEGWMNPLWTLHTALMMDLLEPLCNLETVSRSVYSDDVAMLTKILIMDQKYIDMIFTTIKDHCAEFGMTVKLLQTSVTKNRVTMLRQHYFKGQRADATLKRLLAVSAFNNNNVVSQELECNAISSSCSSALELTEHVATITFIKWYRSSFVNARLFSAFFDEIRSDSLIMDSSFPADIRTLLWAPPGDLTKLLRLDKKNLGEMIIDRITEYLNKTDDISHVQTDLDLMFELFGYNPNMLSQIKRSDIVLYLLTENDFFQEMYWFFMALPSSIGGKGVNLLLNDIVSGHSDGFLKQLYYLKEYIDNHSQNSEFFYKWLQCSLGHTLNKDREFDPISLASNTWLGSPDVTSVTTYLTKQITKHFERVCENNRIRTLLNTKSHKDEFIRNLIKIFNKKIQPRILQFYVENSVYHILDILVRKVETSSGFISKLKNIGEIRRKIHSLELYGLRRSLTIENESYGNIDRGTEILDYLVQRRACMFPDIKFPNIEEPLYDHTLSTSTAKRIMFSVVTTHQTLIKEGKKIFKSPVFSNEVLYKGELITEGGLYTCIEELLISKLVSITMWMTNKQGLTLDDYFKKDKNSLYAACDLSLSTLANYKYSDIVPYVPLTTGGEILHRLPNMRFKNKTTIRSLPLTAPMFDIHINQAEVAHRNLEDSNINFDYIRSRLIVLHSLKALYVNSSIPFTHYYMKPDKYIDDVSQFNITTTTIKEPRFPITYSSIVGREPSFTRINQLSFNYLHSSDTNLLETLIPKMPTEQIILTKVIIVQQAALNFYKDLQKNFLTLSFEYDPLETWTPLLVTLRDRYNIYNDVVDSVAFDAIKEILRTYKETLIVKQLKHNVVFDYDIVRNQLLNSDDDDLINIQFYLDKLQILTRKFNNVNDFNNDDEVQLQLTQEYTKINVLRRSMEESYIFYLIVKYCMQLVNINGMAILDRQITHQNILNLLSEARLVLSSNIADIALLDLIGPNQSYLTFTRYIDEVMTKIDEKLQLIDVTDTILYPIKPDVRIPKRNDVEINIPQDAESAEYNFMSIDKSFFTNYDVVLKTLIFIRHTVSLYSNTMVYWSPTDSDSYVSQFALFNSLIKKKFIIETETVCDLTAGRGDGELALRRLMLQHKSFSRKDTYTATPFRQNIEFIQDYDILKFETLKMISLFDLIHIDVSFVGKDRCILDDLVLNLVRLKKKFTIRINSISFTENILKLIDLFSNYNIYITIPISEGLKPYQTYLFGMPKLYEYDTENQIIKNALWHKSWSRAYGVLIRLKNMFREPTSYIRNSSTHLFEVESSFSELAEQMLNDDDVNNQTRLLSRIDKHFNLLNNIWISPRNLPVYVRKMIDEVEDDLLTSETGVYEEYSNDDVGGTKKHVIKKMNNHLKELKEPQEKILQVLLSTKTYKLFRELAYHHPLKKIRQLINDIIIALDQNLLLISFTHPELMESLDYYKNSITRIFPASNRILTKSFLILIYSAMIGKYDYGLKYLWFLYKTKPDRITETIRTLEEYRKISSLYVMLQEKLAHNEVERRLRDKIFNKIIKPTLIQHVLTTRRLKTVKDNISSDVENLSASQTTFEVDWQQVFDGFMGAFSNYEVPFFEFSPVNVSVVTENVNVSTDQAAADLGSALEKIEITSTFDQLGQLIADIPDELLDELREDEWYEAEYDEEGGFGYFGGDE